jgi:type I restriction enzyme S subunit
MNADRLLAHFERISEAPDAIARLRRFILDLAVRGKLVEQDPEDEPAEELLESITAEKRYLEKLGEIRASKKIPDSEEPPFCIPMTWAWTQLACIGSLSPRNLAPDSSSASFVPMPLISSEYGVLNGHEVRPWGEIKKGYTHFAEGDVGLAKITPCFENGKSTVFRSLAGAIGSGTTELHIIRPLQVSPDFILLFLKSPHFIQTGIPRMTGTAGQKRVPLDYFAHSPFPLPPLAEQHRIVAKVDELMALCDQLEAARQQREQGRERLVAATLQRLNQPAEDPASFHKDASFALQVLPSLTTTPAQIKQLRQTILNLAVRGKLVEQDPEDEPADVRLVQIQRALSSTIASMGLRLKRSSSLSPAASPEGDFAGVPSSWALSTLGSLAIVLDPNPSHRYPSYDGGTVPILSTQEFSGLDGWDPSTAKLVPHSFFEYQLANCRFERGDIVFARKGRLGLPRLLPNFEQFTFSHTVFLVKPMPGVFPEYLLWLLRRDQVIAWLTNEMNANTGVPTLGKEKMELLPIPLPPLAEQHRIVAKVGELMALCDQLEQQLSQADQQRRRLLEAVLAEALGGRLPTEEEIHATVA